ncbi:hypothetical protein ACLJB8_09435, partial [Campylobacter coli]|uniref:hypothetical protein n=1 Tax=Campylobacter coli TaxID=195 RepID=UPI003F7BB5EE
ANASHKARNAPIVALHKGFLPMSFHTVSRVALALGLLAGVSNVANAATPDAAPAPVPGEPAAAPAAQPDDSAPTDILVTARRSTRSVTQLDST